MISLNNVINLIQMLLTAESLGAKVFFTKEGKEMLSKLMDDFIVDLRGEAI